MRMDFSSGRIAKWQEVEPIWLRRFSATDRETFVRIWSEIASICGVDPSALHENDSLKTLCEVGRWPVFSGKMQALEALVLAESKELPPPVVQPNTVGEVVDYLLQRHTSSD